MKKIKKLNLERKAIWFFVQGDLFWTVNVNNDLPEGALAGIDLAFDLNSTSYHLGYYQHRACILIDLQHQAIELPFGRWTSLRELMADAEPEFFNMAGRAWQVANFVRTHQFCGQCGEKKIASRDCFGFIGCISISTYGAEQAKSTKQSPSCLCIISAN